ncbi:hypothetical protein CPLU01_08570 [Colletotrichum plurivorum]|uniref:Apple domain-containing protein n=1 Tax=Colletotrichum plurivorum TaxID=2175906 RepID=A0A8H6KBI9_9PEZI|nr:hypothetical protein CPLU01_08570 [Colletotrichum plurivorum]
MRRAENDIPPRSGVCVPPPRSNIRLSCGGVSIERTFPARHKNPTTRKQHPYQIRSPSTDTYSLKQSSSSSTSCPLPSSSSCLLPSVYPPPSPSPTSSFTSIPLVQEASPVQEIGRLNCPGLSPSNRTYAVPGASWLRFRRDCGSNYPGGDLGQLHLTRMEDCLNLCAALQVTVQSVKGRCIGVVWKTATRASDPLAAANYCWLKYSKGQGFADDPEVEAAWIVDG